MTILPTDGWCNGCDGKGVVRPSECSYEMSIEHVSEWIEFLTDCGGFAIW